MTHFWSNGFFVDCGERVYDMKMRMIENVGIDITKIFSHQTTVSGVSGSPALKQI